MYLLPVYLVFNGHVPSELGLAGSSVFMQQLFQNRTFCDNWHRISGVAPTAVSKHRRKHKALTQTTDTSLPLLFHILHWTPGNRLTTPLCGTSDASTTISVTAVNTTNWLCLMLLWYLELKHR